MTDPPTREPYAVTTFRIKLGQWRWLRQKALERAAERGYGKADASEMLREYLQDPRGPVARSEEIDEFGSAVDDLRRAVDRLQDRLDGDRGEPE